MAAQPINPTGVTFDAAPLQQATSVNVPAPAGVSFDDPTSQATTVSVPGQPSQPVQPVESSTYMPTATISAVPKPDGVAANVEQWADQVKNDLMNGTTNTRVGELLHFLGAHGLAKGVSPETAQFMGSPLLGPTQVLKGAAELPQSGKRWQGVKNTVGGALDTATIPGAFVAPEAGELAGAGSEAAFDAAGNAARATGRVISKPFSLQAVQDALEGSHADIQRAFETGTKAIQDDWHDTVRGIFDQAAKDAGVTPENATSLHDLAANVSDAVKDKAQALYRQADAAVGGTRFQSYQAAVKNIRSAIREEVGLDPERDAQLQQRLADAEAGHQAAKETLAQKGLDPGIIDTADELWRKGSALSDVSKPIQASISGLRADLQGAGAAMESLSPAKLAARVNALYDKGRLQQALGEGGSSDLLTAIESTKQRLKDAALGAKQQAEAVKATAARDMAKVQANRNAAKYAGSVGAAAVGGSTGYELLKHLLGF